MIFSLYMLSPFVTSWLFGVRHCTTIIAIKCERFIHIWNNFHISQELTEPNGLFSCFTSCTYSASMVESAIQDCLMLLHTMAPPPRVNTVPDVDFLESTSV